MYTKTYRKIPNATSVQHNLAKGLVAILSPLTASNAFVNQSINQSISACCTCPAADEQCTHAKLHYSGPAHAPSKMPLPMRDIDPHLWSIPVSHTNDISVSVAILHGSSMSHSPHNLQWTARAPFNGAPSRGGSGPPSNTWFLGHESASQMASRSIHLFLHS